jgi:ATP-dependent Clp protease ATP-binding subunit ClpX
MIYVLLYALQIDTKNILFICGGAFVDLEKTISERLNIRWHLCFTSDVTGFSYSGFPFIYCRRHDSSIGFGAPVRSNMRTGSVINAEITSTLLESVSQNQVSFI